jgi:predicted RNase H-like HicB family nuclease
VPGTQAEPAGFIYLQIETDYDPEVGRFVAGSAQLDVWSSGETDKQAFDRAQEAILLFLNEATEMGTIRDVLKQADVTLHSSPRPKPVVEFFRHLAGVPHPVVFAVPSSGKRAAG